MSLSFSDAREVLEALERVGDFEFVELTLGDLVLRAAKTPEAMANLEITPVPVVGSVVGSGMAVPGTGNEPQLAPTGTTPPSDQIPEGMIAIRSPMAGIFYTTPSPEEPAYVEEGSEVTVDDTLCLVEVMKLFNSVQSSVAGKVHRILAVHGEPVVLDQVLMIIEPAGEAG